MIAIYIMNNPDDVVLLRGKAGYGTAKSRYLKSATFLRIEEKLIKCVKIKIF